NGAMTTGHQIPGGDPSDGRDAEPTTNPAPEPSHAERVRTLLAGAGRGTLSTIAVDPAGYPFGSIVSFGLDERGRPSFFVSTMAEHTRNLDAAPRARLLLSEEAPPGADPLAAGRVTLIGSVGEGADPDERAAA